MTASSAPERTPTIMTKEQKRRVEAIAKAKDALRGTGLTSGPGASATDIINLADYILHGKQVR